MKKIDFKDKGLFIGLDVHKKSWSVTIVVDGIEHRTFTQPADPKALQNNLQRMFPGGIYNSSGIREQKTIRSTELRDNLKHGR